MQFLIPDQALIGGGFVVDSRAKAIVTNIPANVNAVSTNGYLLSGDGGGGTFKRVAGPLSDGASFQSADGAWWLLTSNPVNPLQFGCKGDNVTNDQVNFQKCLDFSLNVFIPVTTGFKVNNTLTLRSGHIITGYNSYVNGSTVNFQLFSMTDLTGVIFDGLKLSQNWVVGTTRNVFCCIYGIRTANVTVRNCTFYNTGLFAVSSDVGGSNWTVTNNYFENVAGSAFDNRGGPNSIVTDNTIVGTGDDAITVTNTPGVLNKRAVIANNIIINPGQLDVGGGGIRVGGKNILVDGNNIQNAVLFFVNASTLSSDGSVKPDNIIITNNIGAGIKPLSSSNTTGCVLVKNALNIKIDNNIFDPVGDNAVVITNVVNNGSGKCQYIAANHGYSTGNVVRVIGVVGVPGANGVGTVTKIDANTFDITALTFSGAYVSGGTALNAITGIRCYSGDDSPSQNNKVVVTNNQFNNIENLLIINLLGVNNFIFTGNEVSNYNNFCSYVVASNSTKIAINGNTFSNSYGNALFQGIAGATITNLEIDNNTVLNTSVSQVPINFSTITATYAECLNNKLGRCTTIFQQANNVTELMINGDFSQRRYNQGIGTITTGNTSVTVNHGGTNVKPGEIRVPSLPTGGSAVAVTVTDIFSTTFVAKIASALGANFNFNWIMSPVVQRYVNGTLAS